MDLQREFNKALSRQAELAADPSVDPFATLFAGRTKREREEAVMMHFSCVFGEKRLGLFVEHQLPEGQDPPDYRCRDTCGRFVGVELVELADEAERQANCYRRAMVAREGRHENSLPVPPGTQPGMARLLTERHRIRQYTEDEGLQALQQLLETKGRKLARRRAEAQTAWDYAGIVVLIWTTNWFVSNRAFFRSVESRRFAAPDPITKAFFVPQPFVEYGDAIIELPLAR